MSAIIDHLLVGLAIGGAAAYLWWTWVARRRGNRQCGSGCCAPRAPEEPRRGNAS